MALDLLNSVLDIENIAKTNVLNAMAEADILTNEKKLMADEIIRTAVLEAETIAKKKWLLMDDELKNIDVKRKDELQVVCEDIKKVSQHHINDAINMVIERIVSGWQ